MTKKRNKKALGRGLDSLLPTGSKEDANQSAVEVDVDRIFDPVFQPRRRIDLDKLKELADSIAEIGIIEPLIVRPVEGGYQLICGERRLRAAKMVGLKKVPVISRDVSDEVATEIAIVENIQRENLSPIEEATGYKKLKEEGYTDEEIAKKVGKSRAAITNTMRLLKLDQDIQDAIHEGKISEGHGRALLAIDSPSLRRKVFKDITTKRLSVREVEEIAKRHKKKSLTRPMRRKSPELIAIEEKLREIYGTEVSITMRGNKGSLRIMFTSVEELNHILDMLGYKGDEL